MAIATALARARARVLPPLHGHVLAPRGHYAARHIRPEEFVGRLALSPAAMRRVLERRPDTYRNSLASVKYREDDERGREYEIGSWAHREDGVLGVWQTHLMPFPGGENTVDAFAHYERSPLRAPRKHYRGIGWDAREGVDRARALFSTIGLDVER